MSTSAQDNALAAEVNSSVAHDAAGKRFVLKCDDPEGKDAQLCYHQDGTTLDFWHTEVPASQRYGRRARHDAKANLFFLVSFFLVS